MNDGSRCIVICCGVLVPFGFDQSAQQTLIPLSRTYSASAIGTVWPQTASVVAAICTGFGLASGVFN
jgi:hypothetical protein